MWPLALDLWLEEDKNDKECKWWTEGGSEAGYFLFDWNEKYFVGRDPLRTKFLIFILVCLRFAFRDFMPEYLTRMSGNARVPVNAQSEKEVEDNHLLIARSKLQS